MAEYINKYANDAAIQAAVDGGELLKPYVTLDESTGLIDWNSKSIDYRSIPLTFEILSDGNINWKSSSTAYTKTIEVSVNGGLWTSETITNDGLIISVVSGDTIQFRGNNNTYSEFNYNSYTRISSTCMFNIYGNIMSLISSDNYRESFSLTKSYCFAGMFRNCTGLTDASKLVLPATTLVNNCYREMFQGCTRLTTAPELPATTLVNSCYLYMFDGCTRLTTAPELPATTLVLKCYQRMFFNCNNLNYIKCLATDISASGSLIDWVSGVQTTSGTFVTPSTTNWSTGVSGIPTNWTRVNSD